MVLIEELPPNLLDNITSSIISKDPSLQSSLLSALGKNFDQSACRVIFNSLSIPDDNRYFHPSTLSTISSTWSSPSRALLLNPKRYGEFVSKLVITDPITFAPLVINNGFADPLANIQNSSALGSSPQSRFNSIFGFDEDSSTSSLIMSGSVTSGLSNISASSTPPVHPVDRSSSKNSSNEDNGDDEDSDDASEGLGSAKKRSKTKLEGEPSPISARNLYDLLQHCPNLEELVWSSSCPPPNGLCEALARYCPRLGTFNAALGRTLKRLSIGTKGTKLTDKGVIALIEGCDLLEEFSMIEVEGRLSKKLWTKLDPELLPVNLHTIRICLNDTTAHHSWTFDHLLSFPAFPLTHVSKLCIRRVGGASALLRNHSISGFSSVSGSIGRNFATGTTDPETKKVPREIMRMLVDNPGITTLECDWWSWAPDDLKAILEHCPNLENVTICLDAPFPKLLAMVGALGSAQNLRKLHVSVTPEHAPSPPPSPPLPTPSNPLSPDASPSTTRRSFSGSSSKGSPSIATRPLNINSVRARKDPFAPRSSATGSVKSRRSTSCSSEVGALATSVSDMAISPNPTISSLPSLEAALPPQRDIKKVFKRCSQLTELEWTGWGTWYLSPSSIPTKSATSLAAIKVEYVPPNTTQGCDLPFDYSDAVRWNWTPPDAKERDGWNWEGARAEAIQAEVEDSMQDAPSNGGTSLKSPNSKRRSSLSAVATLAMTEGQKSRRAARGSVTSNPLDAEPDVFEQTPHQSEASDNSGTGSNGDDDSKLGQFANRGPATPIWNGKHPSPGIKGQSRKSIGRETKSGAKTSTLVVLGSKGASLNASNGRGGARKSAY
ncbi:peroxin [Tulasnella sp. 419]|nr:peroxin [Tulasnella sp. 419]